MNIGVFVILLLVVAAYVAYPLLRSEPARARRVDRRVPGAGEPVEVAEPLARENEFDEEMGTLPAEYRDRMAGAVSSVEALGTEGPPAGQREPGTDLDEQIERKVSGLREAEIERKVAEIRTSARTGDSAVRQAGEPAKPATQPPAGRQPQAGMKCPRCGATGVPGARFCGNCGTPYAARQQPAVRQQPRAPRCPRCGALSSPGDRFCEKCGAPMRRETK